MNKMTLDQNEDELFTNEVSDEVLEVAGCAETAKANTLTHSGSVLLCIFAQGLNGRLRLFREIYSNFADMIADDAFAKNR